MADFLLQLGTMSVQATIIIGVVLLLRFIFSKLHIAKKYTNLLWVIPYIAMILPWGIEAPFSFWQITQESQTKIEQAVNTMPYIAGDLVWEEIEPEVMQEMIDNRYAPPTLDDLAETNTEASTGKDTAGEETGTDVPSIGIQSGSIPSNDSDNAGFLNGVTTWDAFIYVAFTLWLLGLFIFLMYGVVSSLKLKKRLVCSLLLGENVYVADDIKEPFVFGVISPKIYLPCNLTRDDEYYVVEHEKTHIQRKDPIKKIIAFVITGIHWFNPFAWLAFHMMTKDMEMACDEETVQRIGVETRKEYATALLKLSTKRKNLLIPVAFGEGNVKSRINNVLKYKKTIKVFAVIAAVMIILVAVVFLTKPVEKTGALADVRHIDTQDGCMTLPKADSQRPVTVTYKGKEYVFDESFYDTFRIFLEELEVYEEEINKSRDENRPADVVIQIGGTAYNFDENMETFWCNNGVKPSFSYEIAKPKIVIQFLEAQISVYEGAEPVLDEDTLQTEDTEQLGEMNLSGYSDVSYVDLQPKGEEAITDEELCGENGPFLDYADDRYVVFHTMDLFYVYDMVLDDMIWGVGLNCITDVEVDAEELKAYIYDLVGDAIYIYECDIANESYVLAEGMPKVDEFDDFLVTSESVPQDPTVYRTKECIKTADGNYLYLESGSGLLKDLRLIIEDEDGNKESCDMFVFTTTYSGKQDKVIQMLTDGRYVEMMDITHDGEMEYIVVNFGKIQEDRQETAVLKVVDKEGNVIWQKEMFLAVAGWDSYYRVQTDKGECFMQYLPIIHQDQGDYSYRVFYLNEDGSEVEVAKESVSFIPYPLNESVSAEEAIPREEMVQFANNANEYFEGARLLISTVDGGLRYQTPGRTYSYKEIYQMATNMASLDYAESIELNITKLQNYYEKARRDILGKSGIILIEE